MAQPIVDVLVPVALDQAYSYRVPADMELAPGDLVSVPLGARTATGVVWADNVAVRPGLHNRLKDVEDKLDIPPLKPELRSFVDWEISLGDFVLSGGEPAALAIVDATVRLLPGAMSDLDSARGDSFFDQRGLSAPSYTRPPSYRGHDVPEVLLSGDHKRIAEWRRAEGERLTREREAREQAHRGVRDAEIALDRIEQDREDLPVDEVHHVDDEEQAEHVARLGRADRRAQRSTLPVSRRSQKSDAKATAFSSAKTAKAAS